jgi:hypothetical protein
VPIEFNCSKENGFFGTGASHFWNYATDFSLYFISLFEVMNKMRFSFQGNHGFLSVSRNRGRIKIGCSLSYLDKSGMGNSRAMKPSSSRFHGNESKRREEDK